MILPPVLEALAFALLHFVWQGMLIAGGLALVRLAAPRATADFRYATAGAALLLMATAPVATFALLWSAMPSAAPPLPSATMLLLSSTEQAPVPLLPRLLPWILGAWLCGTSWMTLRLLAGWIRLRVVLRRESRPVGAELELRLRRLIRAVGLSRPVRLLTSPRAAVPMLVGAWRPVILLPAAALTGLPPAYLETALLHELAHLRRRDHWVNLLQLTVDALLFYHPAVWWVSRTLRAEREHCCDEIVVATTGDRLGYARALTELEALRAEPLPQALASNGGSLMARIQHIVRSSDTVGATRGNTLLVAATMGFALAAFVLGIAVPANLVAGADDAIVWMPTQLQQWQPHFTDAASEHGVDPKLLAILTLVESGGNPEAESRTGALGLMQIMPATAARIAEVRGIDDFTVDQLRDPATNIDFGAWYIATQLADFGVGTDDERTIELAAAAYNGGPKQLQAYLESGAPLSDETRHYKSLVTSLWQERDELSSPVYERWFDATGRRRGDRP